MTSDNPQSWVTSANGHDDFTLHNLPFGIFSQNGSGRRAGVAIGDQILDVPAALKKGLLEGDARPAAEAASDTTLNRFFALAPSKRRALRTRLIELLRADSKDQKEVADCLYPADDCQMHLPAQVGDYTDFYVGIHHAENIGSLLRPDNPLLPNYKYVPIGYHGRASTIRLSGTPVSRPQGQIKPKDAAVPTFSASRKLDYELELGIWVGPGNELGRPIPIQEAGDHIVGFCLLNDWSARDIQAWEYQPLGPFLSKSFLTSISPWVVTAEALEPYRRSQTPRPADDPQPLDYLLDENDQRQGALDIELEVLLHTPLQVERNLPPTRLALSNTAYMYWTVAQMVTHHSVNGCQLNPGDLFGSGTLSGPNSDQTGSLMELTRNGEVPLELNSGETRTFLEDGDEVILRARCRRDGLPGLGFGECRGTVTPSPAK